jgi:hypothetical protein
VTHKDLSGARRRENWKSFPSVSFELFPLALPISTLSVLIRKERRKISSVAMHPASVAKRVDDVAARHVELNEKFLMKFFENVFMNERLLVDQTTKKKLKSAMAKIRSPQTEGQQLIPPRQRPSFTVPKPKPRAQLSRGKTIGKATPTVERMMTIDEVMKDMTPISPISRLQDDHQQHGASPKSSTPLDVVQQLENSTQPSIPLDDSQESSFSRLLRKPDSQQLDVTPVNPVPMQLGVNQEHGAISKSSKQPDVSQQPDATPKSSRQPDNYQRLGAIPKNSRSLATEGASSSNSESRPELKFQILIPSTIDKNEVRKIQSDREVSEEMAKSVVEMVEQISDSATLANKSIVITTEFLDLIPGEYEIYVVEGNEGEEVL